MQFDFDTFSRIAERAYRSIGPIPYSLADVLRVFWLYFAKYEEERGAAHPNIRLEQIRRAMEAMPWADPDNHGCDISDIYLEDYEYLIDQHFATKYKSCDYNINHFFTGKVRWLRFCEVLRTEGNS